MKVYEAIATVVAREGVGAVFGLMGDGNLKFIPYLTEDLGVAFIGARHEGGAVAMADGYARVTGAVGVCTFTQGPGLTNALTALVSAQRGRTPMVVLCGDTPGAVPGLPQDIDQGPFLAAAGVAVQPLSPADAPAAARAAFRRARAESRPIALNLPTDMQERDCTWLDEDERATPDARRPPEPSEQDLGAAADAIERARRPVVIAGRGAMASGAREAITALADRTGALLATSLPAKSWFAGHPFEIGIAGGFASEMGRSLIGEADCIVVMGASLNHFTSRGGTLFDSAATVIQCDVEPTAFGRYVPAQVTVLGDAHEVARSLAGRLVRRAGFRTAEVEARISRHASGAEDADDSEIGSIDPRALSRAIDAAVPSNRTLVVDGGHFMGFPSTEISVPDPSHFVFTLDFGSIGLALGAAVGAAVARPDRVTVTAIGDGGLMLSLGELDTAVRYSLPLLVVVYNDRAYGAEMHFLRMLDLPDAEALFDVPPLDEVARAMGADGVSINTLDELSDLRPRLKHLERPMLLDCRISQDIRASWLEEAFQRGTH